MWKQCVVTRLTSLELDSERLRLATLDLILLPLALAKIGRNDVAYRLIHNDTFPSWGFSPSNTTPPASGRVGIWKPQLSCPLNTLNMLKT